ncbi:hypothetical protein DIPPA_22402 [Diplonema papillatum]|nr:hypothetical protein DIPPA_22402 [Diplonema papillatum]
MMRPFTEKWAHFISFDFIAMFLLACVTVPRTASFIGCGAVKLLIALINCLQLGADLYCRPHNRYRDNWADIARFSLQAVASFAMAIGYFTDDPVSSMFTLAVYLFLASMLFLILKLVFDLGAEVYLLFKSRRPRLQEKAWSEDEGGEMMTPSFDHKMLHNIHSPHDDLESSDLSSSKKLGYVMSPRSDLDRIVEVKESDLAYIRTGSEYLPPAHRKGSDTLDSVRSNQSPSRKTSRRVSRKNSAALPPRDTDEFRPPSRVNSQLRIALPHDCRSTSPDDGLARSPTVGSPRRTSRRKTAPSCDVREDLSPEPTNSAAGSPGPRYPTPQARLPPVAKALSPKASTDGCVQSTDEPSQNARNSRRTSRRESVPVDKMVPMAAQEFVSVDGEPAGGAGLARRASRAKAGGKEIADLNLVPTTSDAELSGSGLSACNSGSPGDKSLFSLRRKPEANAARTGCLELSIGHASSDPESASQGAQQIPPLPPKSSFWKPPTVSPAASPKTLGSPSFPQTFSKPPKAASPLPRPSPRNAEEDII